MFLSRINQGLKCHRFTYIPTLYSINPSEFHDLSLEKYEKNWVEQEVKKFIGSTEDGYALCHAL